jgi:hypothetical protein
MNSDVDPQAVIAAALDWLELSNDRPRFRERIPGIIVRVSRGGVVREDHVLRPRLAHLTPEQCKLRHDEAVELLAAAAESFGISTEALYEYQVKTGEYERYDPRRNAEVLVQRLLAKAKAALAGRPRQDAAVTATQNQAGPLSGITPPFMPTDLQTGILMTLDGRALAPKDLIRELNAKDTLYKPGGIPELLERKLVVAVLHRPGGTKARLYYRPDRLPDSAADMDAAA